MDILKNEFKAVFKTPMEEEGFTYAGNCFYRLSNDVLQTLTLNRTFNFGFEFKFTIVPLCIPMSKFLPSGIMGPIESSDAGKIQYFYRNYTKDTSAEIIHAYMTEGRNLIFQDIIPIFQRGFDSAHAYTELIAAETERCGTPTLHSPLFKWLALMSGNYERAFIHQAAIIACNMGNPTITEDEILAERMLEKLKTVADEDPPYLREQKEDLKRISQKRKDYFDPIIAENTRLSLEFLQKADKSPCKYGSCRY